MEKEHSILDLISPMLGSLSLLVKIVRTQIQCRFYSQLHIMFCAGLTNHNDFSTAMQIKRLQLGLKLTCTGNSQSCLLPLLSQPFRYCFFPDTVNYVHIFKYHPFILCMFHWWNFILFSILPLDLAGKT